MGELFSKLYNTFASMVQNEHAKICMLGLDAAGKTTILYKIKFNENIESIPTIGFNVETVTPVKGLTFTVWDVGGQGKIRSLWHHYFRNSHGLIFVVDSNDRERLDEAKGELFGILSSDEMRGVPLVVMANKQDLPNAMSASQLVEGLELRQLKGHKWHLESCCAKDGKGVFESMEQMAKLSREFQSGRR